MIRKSEQSGPSEVEIAGGYLLDRIRAEREAKAAYAEFDRATEAVKAASQQIIEKNDAFVVAETHLDVYIQASVEA